MFRITLIILMTALFTSAEAFCGFYVAQAGSELFNKKSSVILARDGNRSTITMSSDFEGNVKEFAMVVPVPVVLKRKEIQTVETGIFQRFDSYSAPRLVEYYDRNPCQVFYELEESVDADFNVLKRNRATSKDITSTKDQVTIEAEYAVGEYDIIILSAKESTGLKNWLNRNNYAIPQKAERVLDPYIKDGLKFFVVKVNLKRHRQMGKQPLKAIQISFESPRFMLPIRLGMANSQGTQDMLVYAFSKTGRIECTNYRTIKIPTDRNVPTFIKSEFGSFYTQVFDRTYDNAGKNAVFLEYAWEVTPSWSGVKCDPCVGPPPINRDLQLAGANWPGHKIYMTRLHVRYDEANFPQDLAFQETMNTDRFQGRYILTHPASGPFDCEDGQQYLQELDSRRKKELAQLALLTGRNVDVYDRYRSEGSGRKNEGITSIPQSDDQLPPNGWLQFFSVIFMIFIGLKAIDYWSDLRTVS